MSEKERVLVFIEIFLKFQENLVNGIFNSKQITVEIFFIQAFLWSENGAKKQYHKKPDFIWN